MSIFLDRSTRVIVQGITGRMAQFHTREMVEILTAAGVTVAENPSVVGETIAPVMQAA